MTAKSKTLEIPTNQKLSIQISLSGLSFCILNTFTNKIFAFEQIEFKKQLNPFEALERLIHYFDVRDYLQTKFDDILVIHDNDLSTLVPKELFSKDNLADYLKFNSKILKSDFLSYDTLNNENTVNIYVPYINVNNYVYETYGSFTFKHFSTILLDKIFEKHIPSETAKIYVHVCKYHFEIVIITNNSLKLYNTFEFNNSEDFIYFILFTIEQLDYNAEVIPLTLLGNISKNDDLYLMVYKYIRNVSIMEHQNNYNIALNDDTSQSNFIITNSL